MRYILLSTITYIVQREEISSLSQIIAILDGVSVALGEAETSDRNAVVMRNSIPLPKRKPQKVVLSGITLQNHLRNYPSKSIVRAHSRPEW